MITQLLTMFRAIEGSHSASAAMQNASEGQMRLANQVRFGGGLSRDTFERGKQLELDGKMAQIQLAVYQLMLEEAQKQLADEFERERRRIRLWYG